MSNYIILHEKIFIHFTCANHFQIKDFKTTIIFIGDKYYLPGIFVTE